MAEIVAGIGVPHTPAFPALVAKQGPNCETAKLYAEIAEQLDAASPNVLIIFTDDHFNTFFLDNFPTFAIGIAETTSGPNDQTPMPHYKVAVPAAFAAHIRTTAIAHGFDISLVQGFDVDHATMVPLHFLTPDMKIPVVPIFIKGSRPRCRARSGAMRWARPSAQPSRTGRSRCAWPSSVAAASRWKSAGPRFLRASAPGRPILGWAAHVQDLLEQARVNDLLEEATAARMLQAGNIGGELLNWIAMLGVIGTSKPRLIKPQLKQGHAYGVWRWN